MKNKIDIDDLSFNLLSDEERQEMLYKEGKTYNPFDIPAGVKLINPFTYEVLEAVDGNTKETKKVPMDDGITVFRNPFTSKIDKKVEFKDGKLLKEWEVDDMNEWKEISRL